VEGLNVNKLDLEKLAAELDAADARRWKADGYTHARDKVKLVERRDFYALDIGTSGAFMVRKADGAVFGIKGYGAPDYRKGVGFVGAISGAELLGYRHRRGPFRTDMQAVTK
jgi:hypothetical protein